MPAIVLQVPLSEDMIFSEKSRDGAEAIFASRKEKSDYVPYEFVVHKGLQSEI